MRAKIFLLINGLISYIVTINSFSQNVYNDSLINGLNYSKAAFRIWIYDNSRPINGIMVLVPGSGYDGRNDVFNEEWQKFSKDLGYALMSCYFMDNPQEYPEIEEYVNVKNGSGQAMLQSIKRMSELSGHMELDTIPLLLFGMSAGGQFNYEFVCWHPERVQAFVVNKGGIYYTALAPSATWNVPGLFISGGDDSPYRINIIKGIFSINRRFGAKWTYAQEYGVEHELGHSEFLAQLFFKEVIKSSNDSDIKYIGLIEERQLVNKEAKIGSNSFTSWIVSKEFGEEWLKFIMK